MQPETKFLGNQWYQVSIAWGYLVKKNNQQVFRI